MDFCFELDAVAGNDGEKHLRGEGRQTAAEYERTVKKLVAERTAREKVAEEEAVKLVEGASLETDEGCKVIAEVLCRCLKDGVVSRGQMVSRIIASNIFRSESPLSKEADARDEAAVIASAQSAAHAFMRAGKSTEENTIRSQIITFLGAVFLNIFMVCNWTGPPLKLPCSPLPAHAALDTDDSVREHVERLCREALEADSEVRQRTPVALDP
jgi:hypothetical protein